MAKVVKVKGFLYGFDDDLYIRCSICYRGHYSPTVKSMFRFYRLHKRCKSAD